MPDRLATVYKFLNANTTTVVSTDSTQMRLFLDFCSIYTRLIKDIYKIGWPLNKYLWKDKKLNWLDRITEALEVFTAVKSKLVPPSVLAIPKPNRLYTNDTNAPENALRAVFLQQ